MHADTAIRELLQLLPYLFIWCLEYVINEVEKATLIIRHLYFVLIFGLICLFFFNFNKPQVFCSQSEAVDFFNNLVAQSPLVIDTVLSVERPHLYLFFQYN